MDLSDPDQKILIGRWDDINVVRAYMRTLTKMKLCTDLYRTHPFSPKELKQNYLYITKKRIVFESKSRLMKYIKDNLHLNGQTRMLEQLWVMYER